MIIYWSFQKSVFGNAQTRAHEQTSFICMYLIIICIIIIIINIYIFLMTKSTTFTIL